MGFGLGGLNLGFSENESESSSSSSSHSETYASELSQAQLEILQNREKLFNDYFFPQLQQAIAGTNAGSAESTATLNAAAQKVNASYGSSMAAVNQNLAQQGLLGESSGVHAALKAANNRSRASSLASAYYDTLSNNASTKATLLNTAASLMTTPTTSAAYYSKSDSSSESSGSGFGIGAEVGIKGTGKSASA